MVEHSNWWDNCAMAYPTIIHRIQRAFIYSMVQKVYALPEASVLCSFWGFSVPKCKYFHNKFINIFIGSRQVLMYLYFFSFCSVCVSVYVCMYCVYMSVCIYIYICVYGCVYMHVCVCVYTCVYISVYICLCICVYMCVYICVYVCVYLCTCLSVSVWWHK